MEIWKDILGYNGEYMVSSHGNVKSLNYRNLGYEQNFVPKKSRTGYLQILINKNGKRKTYLVHRLVAQAFLGLDINNKKMLVCHKNDIKTDNNAENLFLGNHKENKQDSVNKGRHIHHESHHKAKLNKDKVREIRTIYEDHKLNQTQISRIYGVSQFVISQIVRNKIWVGI